MSIDNAPRRPRPAVGVLRALLPFLKPYRAWLAAAAAALLVAAAAALTLPAAFRRMIDVGFVGKSLAEASHDGLSAVNLAFLLLFGLAVVLAVATAARFYLVTWLGERVTADLRRAVYAQVLRQDPVFFETLRPGEVISRLTGDATLIQTLVGSSLSMGLRNALLFVGGLVMLVVTSPALAALIVGMLLLTVLPILVVGRRVRRLSRDSQERVADSSALAGETIGAIQIVQACAREPHEVARFAESVEQGFAVALRRIRARAALTLLAIVLVFGAIVFVLWLGAHAVLEGRMSAGELTQFILYAGMVAMATGALSEVLGELQRAAGATERLLELLQAQPRVLRDASLPEPVAVHKAEPGARVALRAVSFHYPSRPAERALEDVSLEVLPGETVALVGPSGAGKTTLFQLLLRFYDPQSGRLEIDGCDIRSLEPAALREGIGLVSQDSVVFSGDVMENIRYGRLEASDEEVLEAARAAHVDEFAQRLPQGYRTTLGERGVRLSGGQRQRIAIARALLRNPPLLLLDEATSALDAGSEAVVQEALETAMRGRTTLVIAHRLATVIGADRIVVLDRGRVVDIGTHAQLRARGGLYAELADRQFSTPSAQADTLAASPLPATAGPSSAETP